MSKPLLAFVLAGSLSRAFAAIPFDATQVRPGPISVQPGKGSFTVRWPDESARTWVTEFSLEPAGPLINRISLGDSNIVEGAQPLYFCSTGKRRGGWDQFFDLPPSYPDGTRSFTAVFPAHSRACDYDRRSPASGV
jgi:hypothetical protein